MRRHRISGLVCVSVILSMFILGCASKPKPYQQLESSSRLAVTDKYPNTLLFRSPDFDTKKYTKFIVEPVSIYGGKDADFGSISDEDKKKIADLIGDEFKRVISKNYKVVNAPGPDVVRVKFTLAGLEVTRPAAAAATHLIPIGLVINLGKSAAGMQGSFIGSVTMAGEFYDSQTNKLQVGFVTRRSPNAMDVTTMGSQLEAASKSVKEIIEKLGEQIDIAHRGTK